MEQDIISTDENACPSSPPGETFKDKIVLNPIIHSTIFIFLTPLEILLFSRTCRFAQDTVDRYIKSAFNIDRLLARFFSDPLAFRALQARTGTLISGSCALQFFARTFYPESDLDLYIPKDWLLDVVEWLVEEGYTFVPVRGQPTDWREAVNLGSKHPSFQPVKIEEEYTDESISVVLNLSKPSTAEDGASSLKIQCIVAFRGPMQTILSFHSTCVMNIISYEKAYCLYPRGTLHERRSLLCRSTLLPTRPEALEKYRSRGFELISGRQRRDPEYADEHKLYRSFPYCTRYVGDPLCWTVALDMDGLGPTPGIRIPETEIVLPHDPVCTVSWSMSIGYGGGRGPAAVMLYEAQNPPFFYLSCIYTRDGLFKAAVLDFIASHRRSQRVGLKFMERWDIQMVDAIFVDWCLEHYPQLWSMTTLAKVV